MSHFHVVGEFWIHSEGKLELLKLYNAYPPLQERKLFFTLKKSFSLKSSTKRNTIQNIK